MALQQVKKMIKWSDLLNKGISKNLFEMNIYGFHELSMLVQFSEVHMLQHVRKLDIRTCDSLEEVFESDEGMLAKKGYGPSINYGLQCIKLNYLAKLKSIWGPNISRLVSFGKLTSIEIASCNNLKCVVPYSIAKSLVELKELAVQSCEMVEEIVTKEEEEKNMDGGCKDKTKTLFPKLEKLSLWYLPNLKYVCNRDYDYHIPLCNQGEDQNHKGQEQVQIVFPQLKEFKFYDVPNLQCFSRGWFDYDPMLSEPCVDKYSSQIETIPIGKVIVGTPITYKCHIADYDILTLGDINLTLYYLHNYSDKYKVELQDVETFECIDEKPQYKHLVGYMRRVPRLEVESCKKLLTCVPSNNTHSLLFQQLKELHVRQCQNMEAVFEGTGIDKSQLETMELHSLPKLKHIWRNNNSIMGFENLSNLRISRCYDLKVVFPDVSVARSLPNLKEIAVQECEEMGEIIGNNKSLQQKGAKIIFPSLRFILLNKLPKLNCFCSSCFYFELSHCGLILIEECREMETFCDAILYMPELYKLGLDNKSYDRCLEVNKIIRQHKYS